MRKFVIIGATLALTACGNTSERVATHANVVCTRAGNDPGTVAYAQCFERTFNATLASINGARPQPNYAAMSNFGAALVNAGQPRTWSFNTTPIIPQSVTCNRMGYQTTCF